MSQATAGEEEDSEEEGDEDKDINIEKEKAYLMHATSGSGMQAIEVRHSGNWCCFCVCVPGWSHVSITTPDAFLMHPGSEAAACMPDRRWTQ